MSPFDRARQYVATMAPAISGSGGHDATFAAASALVNGFLLEEADALEILREYNLRCKPPWSERELIHKVRSAARSPSSMAPGYLLGTSGGGRRLTRPCSPASPRVSEPGPQYDPVALAAAAGEFRPRLDWFADRSYVDPALCSSHDFLSLLFAGEKVVIFSQDRSQGQALWPEESIPAPSARGIWFLANPVDGLYHPNPRTGKPSRRSEESITRWKFALLESDEAPAPLWLAALSRSALPIAAIYSSGGRSVHALVRVCGTHGLSRFAGAESKAAWDGWAAAIKADVTRLGADPRALTAVRLTRLPQQRRPETGRMQKLIFVNPFPEFGGRILDLAPRRSVVREAREAARAAVFAQEVAAMERSVARLHYYAPVAPELLPMAEELQRDVEELRQSTRSSGGVPLGARGASAPVGAP